MSAHSPRDHLARVHVLEPHPDQCPAHALPPEGNVKLRNYRLLNETLRVYTPTGDIHTPPDKDRLVPRFEVFGSVSPPRARILELVRPEDEGCDALEAIVRPTPRRGLVRPLDDDTRRFLQLALQPSTQHASTAPTPEARSHPPEQTDSPTPDSSGDSRKNSNGERSLAEELLEAEAGGALEEVRVLGSGWRAAAGRERLGRLALAVEADEEEEGAGLSGAARRLDALLEESRALHRELAGIHQDLQAQSARAFRCAAAARALAAESRALRYLDDVVALLKGDVKGASRVRAWPFAIGNRQPGRNYVV